MVCDDDDIVGLSESELTPPVSPLLGPSDCLLDCFSKCGFNPDGSVAVGAYTWFALPDATLVASAAAAAAAAAAAYSCWGTHMQLPTTKNCGVG